MGLKETCDWLTNGDSPLALFVYAATALTGAYGLGFSSGLFFERLRPEVRALRAEAKDARALQLQAELLESEKQRLQSLLQASTADLEAARQETVRLQGEVEQHQAVRRAVLAEESQLWQLYEPRPPVGHASPIASSRARILLIANNKGGVGKTTLTALLGAYFEAKGKRVLFIDLDYQGSLTGLLVKSADLRIPLNQSQRLAAANGLIDGRAVDQWAVEDIGSPKGFARAQLVTADYTLTDHETRLMLRWLLQQGQPDIRFEVARALASPHVQDRDRGYDIVLIDAPPRLTTGAIAALAASTHILVPTILDTLSTETVGSFLRQAWQLKTRLNPGLELAGVVGMMTPARPLEAPLDAAGLEAIGTVRQGLRSWLGQSHVFERDVQSLAAIRRGAGEQVAYFTDAKVRAMIDALGDELSARIGI